MSRPRPQAKYVVQFWRKHFVNCHWVQALEDAAVDDLAGRVFNVPDYWPDSALREVRTRIRQLTAAEVKANGTKWHARTHACLEFSLISADREMLKTEVAKDAEATAKYGIDALVNLSLAVELERFCEIVNYLVAITYAGSMHLSNSKVVIGRQAASYSDRNIVGLGRSEEDYDFLSSGILATLNLDQMLLWSKKCNGIWDGMAATPVEKAVSLLSHTFSSQETRSEVALLLWATAGLEAIACDSNSSVSFQLKRRLPMICDTMPFKNVAKLVSDAYGFRSRLFHGDIPIMNCFNEDEVNWHSGRYDAKLAYYGLVLQLLLLSAIWKAILENSTNLTFVEKVVVK